MKENSNKNRLDKSSTNESSKNDKSVPNEENNIKEDLIGRTLFGKYKVIKKIAEGTQSTIYSGENIKTGEGIAIKTEKKNDNTCLLEQEINILIKLKQHEGIVNLISCGKRKNFNRKTFRKIIRCAIFRFIKKIYITRYMSNCYTMSRPSRIYTFKRNNSL